MGKASRKSGMRQLSSPSGVTQDTQFLQHQICDSACEVYRPGNLIKDSAPRIFIGGWSCRHSASIYETSQVPEGKQMFHINHVVCTVYAQRATLCYHSGNGRNALEIQVPTNQPKATLTNRLSKESSLEPAVGSLLHNCPQILLRRGSHKQLGKLKSDYPVQPLFNLYIPGNLQSDSDNIALTQYVLAI